MKIFSFYPFARMTGRDIIRGLTRLNLPKTNLFLCNNRSYAQIIYYGDYWNVLQGARIRIKI